DLLLLAGDNYFGFSFTDFLSRANNNPLLAAFDIEDKNEAKKFGVVVPKNETEVLEFEEKPENPSSTLVSTGAYFFPNNTLEHILTYSKDHADDLGGIFEFCMGKNISVEYFSFDEEWYDIGSFSAFMSANKYFLQNNLNKDYDTQKIISKTAQLDEISKNFIESDDEKNNFCIIGENVHLENVKITNSIIMDNCILKNVDVSNSLICSNCIIENRDFYKKIIREKTISI
ncbi:TPA: NDP-sugar synthase, partial [Candidatus Peregrinibacteria bacterium]|nr:NDP-sugar synthase [Candidatus Peregrinibacteria bacterium]